MRTMLTATFDDRTTAESFVIFLRHHDYMTDSTMPTNLVAEAYPVYFWLDVCTLETDLRAIAGAWGKGIKKVETPGHVFSFTPVDAPDHGRKGGEVRSVKPIDTSLRPVPGGFIRRVNLGDRWMWLAYRADGSQIPFSASNRKDAMAKVTAENERQAPDHGRKGGSSGSAMVVPFHGPINTEEDVRAFFRALLQAGVSFHTDADFGEYVNADGSPSFSPFESYKLNALMGTATVLLGERADAIGAELLREFVSADHGRESGRKGGEVRLTPLMRASLDTRAEMNRDFPGSSCRVCGGTETNAGGYCISCLPGLKREGEKVAAMIEAGRKGGSASSSVVDTPSEPYIGIDYGMGMSNVDHATGCRYGVIAQNSLCQESLNDSMEADYGDPACPDCGGDVLPADEVKHPDLWTRRMDKDGTHGCFDYACLSCRKGWDSGWATHEDPIGHFFSGDGYELVGCLDSDVMILKSPYYTHAQFCSPCVPGAGNLDSPMPNGVRTFCLSHDWFEDGVAPYPVYLVSDDSEVSPDPAPGGMTLRQWQVTAPVGFAINDNMPLVAVPDVPAIAAIRAFLWNLVDYRVESVRAGTIFLALRAKTGESC